MCFKSTSYATLTKNMKFSRFCSTILVSAFWLHIMQIAVSHIQKHNNKYQKLQQWQ